MSNFAFNIGKGRAVELYIRVKNNDPANSALILVPLSATDTEANLQDLDDLTAVLAAAPNEAGGSWGRKTLTDVELAAVPAPDDTNNRYAVPVPQVTWTGPTTGQNTTGILICYDPDTTAGTDSTVVPLVHCDFVNTADNNAIVLSAGDFLRDT